MNSIAHMSYFQAIGHRPHSFSKWNGMWNWGTLDTCCMIIPILWYQIIARLHQFTIIFKDRGRSKSDEIIYNQSTNLGHISFQLPHPRWNTLSQWTPKGTNSNTKPGFLWKSWILQGGACCWWCHLRGSRLLSHCVSYYEYYGGVGWVNHVHGHFHTRVMLRYCAFSCTSTHTSCYTTVRSLLLPHIRHDDNDDDDNDHDDDK